jgi:hypothetical protein
MELKKRLEDIMSSHETVIKASDPKISIPIQTSFTRVPLSVTRRATLLGFFYENLNRALYGGELNDIKYDVRPYNGNSGEGSVKPDVVDHGGRIVWEAKGCVAGHSCNVMNSQLEGYKYLQYIYPDAKVLFALYRHTLKGIKSKPTEGLSEGDIVRELTHRSIFSVVLPLGLILRLQEIPSSQGINHARLYEGSRNWPDCLVINPRTIDGFLFDPEQVLKYLDLDSKDFVIERYRSPSNLRVNRRKIKPLPIVRILHRDHWDWAERFMNDNKGEMEVFKEDIGKLPLFKQEEDLPF